MTPRRMMTSLSAAALGLAIAGAFPALAQTNTQSAAPSGTNGAAAPMPAAPAPAAPAPAAPAPATPPNTANSANTNNNMPGNTAQGTAKQGQMQSMTHRRKSTMHHVATREPTSRRYGSSEANPNAQNGAVDQLNQQSLQAAQQGRSFSPSGHM